MTLQRTATPDEALLFLSTDSQVWAREFMLVVDAGAVVDEALMVGWFANAMETAKTLFQWEEWGKKYIGPVVRQEFDGELLDEPQ